MSDLFRSLLPLHRLAARHGQGLRPEILEVLQQEASKDKNVVQFQVNAKSVGLVKQMSNEAGIINSKTTKFHYKK